MKHYIVFDDYKEASNAHKRLLEILEEKGVIRYTDLLKACEIDGPTILIKTYECGGWTDLKESRVEKYEDKYWALVMPTMIDIEGETTNED